MKLLRLITIITMLWAATGRADSAASFCRSANHQELVQLVQETGRNQLIFFASWCSSCRDHIIESDAKQVIYVVAYDDPAPATAALQALQPGADLCLIDHDYSIRKALKVRSLPAKRQL